jgi:hypothetical protein
VKININTHYYISYSSVDWQVFTLSFYLILYAVAQYQNCFAYILDGAYSDNASNPLLSVPPNNGLALGEDLHQEHWKELVSLTMTFSGAAPPAVTAIVVPTDGFFD